MRFAIVLLITALLQGSNLPNVISVSGLNIKPDLLAILLVIFALNCDEYSAIIASFSLGFMADIIRGPMGPYIITYTVIGALLANSQRLLVFHKAAHRIIAIFIFSIIIHLTAGLLTMFKIRELHDNFIIVVGGISLYSALTAPLIWWVIDFLSGWFGLRSTTTRMSRRRAAIR